MTIPAQPVLPAEEVLTPMERLFIAESPPNLWPENQDSNLGAVRKIFTDKLQESVDELTSMFLNLFATTADVWMDKYERELGLPVNPSLDLATRRIRVLRRMRRGAWTYELRIKIVEDILSEILSFGEPTAFTPTGIPLTSGGVTLYSGTITGTLTDHYRITENITNFSYNVDVDPAVDIDQDALVRELEHFTPAGISFTITRVGPPY